MWQKCGKGSVKIVQKELSNTWRAILAPSVGWVHLLVLNGHLLRTKLGATILQVPVQGLGTLSFELANAKVSYHSENMNRVVLERPGVDGYQVSSYCFHSLGNCIVMCCVVCNVSWLTKIARRPRPSFRLNSSLQSFSTNAIRVAQGPTCRHPHRRC